MPLPFEFDFRNPDYNKVWRWRLDVLKTIRENPDTLDAFKDYYRQKPGEFINHWGATFDPRNADIGLPTVVPFILFAKQEEWVTWTLDKWHTRDNGLVEKTRDMGMSWLAIALSCTLCLFHNNISIGFGSRKEEYVDKIGDPKSLFWKARMFMDKLPAEFKDGWDLKTHAPHKRILFPGSNSTITGESGDGIGRGDRKSIYFVDEAAYIERPELIEASLSATTNCRIDISSVHGMANPFAQKRHSGKIDVFTFHWRQDPRKDDAWYKLQQEKLDSVTLAQEVDINYNASVEGVVIPAAWIKAAVDACAKLGITPTGRTDAALDVADEGKDLNAMAVKKGVELISLATWSGVNSDSLYTAQKAASIYDELSCDKLQYDADGIGAFIRSDFRVINERRKAQNQKEIMIAPFRGSGGVIMPETEMIKGRKNKDYFTNRKAQSWWSLRLRFQNTYRAISGEEYNPDDIISIPSSLPLFQKLMIELTQPTYSETTIGKILIDKAPDNTRSPNMADALMMVYSPARSGLFS